MRVLVTGLSGFTGRYLAAELAAHGHEVVGLAADLVDHEAVISEVSALAPDAAVHLAGISFVPAASDATVYAVNVLGAEALLKGLLRSPRPVARVVLASSANVYGAREGRLAEGLCPAPVNHYGITKLAMELIAATYADRLPIAVTRPFNYTGVGQAEQFLIPKLVAHFRRRAAVIELGNLDVARDFSDVRWVAAAYRALLTAEGATGLFNLCSGEEHTLGELLDTLSALSGHAMEVRVNPAFVRANEIRRQCGEPARLRTVYPDPPIPLADTLAWMLTQS